MYYSWLDRWDERRGQYSDEVKKVGASALGASLAFPHAESVRSITDFGQLAAAALGDSSCFFGDDEQVPVARWQGGWISFPSRVQTEIPENNTVYAKVTEAGSSMHAVVVFHHWNAESRNAQLARLLAWFGLTVVEIAMPYHLERKRSGSSYADYMLSPDLGRTLQSVRQAVVDGRHLFAILRRHGYTKLSVLGISLGSWVAGIVAAHEPKVNKAALYLTAGSLADMVWTGSATRHIRATLEKEITLGQLRQAWAPLNLENYVDKLARPGLEIQMMLAKRDKVVLPALSEKLASELERTAARSRVIRMNCGHYSVTLPPYIIRAGLSTVRFLNR
ncbi:abhydrolase domain-containing 18 [Paracoccus aurantiacus]|uniref:Abhydrolase domain-containing 18 n=1 Tax=Paracoccus aurantiacus TaxID=2599412 RepID=A0A5C6RPW6_9RHOB|nr:alpha/beta hydrolase family protein [Paracoccus aurantiacus]TXB64416.1 abhydrolase domain-containing 18 [Paracoccus aurantiacus]